MKKVLILGANGKIARFAIPLFLERTDFELTLFARNARHLSDLKAKRINVVEGDVLDHDKLASAVEGHDIVYANLDGDLPAQARNIVAAMKRHGVALLRS